MSGALHINISTLVWPNPHPDREIHRLEIRPGNRQGLDLVLLAVSLD